MTHTIVKRLVLASVFTTSVTGCGSQVSAPGVPAMLQQTQRSTAASVPTLGWAGRSAAEAQSIYYEHCHYKFCAIAQYPVDHFDPTKPTQSFPVSAANRNYWLVFDKLGRRYQPSALGGSIEVYLPGGKTPQAILTVGKQQAADGIAIDKYDNIWTAAKKSIDEYPRLPANAQGSITLAPVKTIGGPKTRLKAPWGLVFDRTSGYLYTLNSPDILAFNPNDAGNVKPVINITGSHTHLAIDSANTFTVDLKGRVLVGSAGSVWIFAPLATGNVAPVAVIRRPYWSLATDAQDNIYAIGAVGQSAELVEFSPSSSGFGHVIRQLWLPQTLPKGPWDWQYAFAVH